MRAEPDIENVRRAASELADRAGFRRRDALDLLAGVSDLTGALLAAGSQFLRVELGLILQGSEAAVEIRAELAEAFNDRQVLPGGLPFDALHVRPMSQGGSRVTAWMWRDPLAALLRGDCR